MSGLGWDADGMCDDHGKFACKKCALTPSPGEDEVTEAMIVAGLDAAEGYVRATAGPVKVPSWREQSAEAQVRMRSYVAAVVGAAIAAMSARPVGEGPWQDYMTGTSLAFDGGVLNLNRDGSGSFACNEREIEWETDDESGAACIVARIARGEAQAIRDWLNKWFPPPGTTPAAPERRSTPEDDGMMEEAVEALRGIVERASDTYTKQNGHLASIEADDGEKCWIVHSDDIEEGRRILARLDSRREGGDV